MAKTLTKPELIDAAVAVVQAQTTAAMTEADHGLRSEYVEAYAVAHALRDQGVLTHPEQDATQQSAKDRVERSLTGKTKRLLDEAAEQGRILRFSSHDHQTTPRLDGQRRSFYGSAVYYTTPELHAKAEAAVVARDAQLAAETDAFDALVVRAQRAGLRGFTVDGKTISFRGVDAVTELVAWLEGRADG